MAFASIALTTSCTTIERHVLPLQPVIVNHYYLVPIQPEPEQNCGGVPNCWYEDPDSGLGEA